MKLNTLSKSEKMKMTREMRTEPERFRGGNRRWKPNHDQLLENMFYQGLSYTDMALALDRSERAISNRITNLKLYTPSNKIHAAPKEPQCLCNCCSMAGTAQCDRTNCARKESGDAHV